MNDFKMPPEAEHLFAAKNANESPSRHGGSSAYPEETTP